MARQKTTENVTTIDDVQGEASAVPGAPEEVKEEIVVKGTNFDDQLSGKKVKIEIFEQEGVDGKEAAFVQVNGYAYQIPRNTICVIPEEVAAAVENAKYTVTQNVGSRNEDRIVKRFAYQILGTVEG